jgi:oligopeptide/dipeptide ABC transporter ATP-binding protein
MTLLEVRNLEVHFRVRPQGIASHGTTLRAVNDVSFSVDHGETIGLIGESGCGKTTLGRAVIRIIEADAGEILFEGQDVRSLDRSQLRSLRRRFQMIFQDPYGSLDPRMKIEDTVGEALDIHRLAPNRTARRRRVLELLDDVGLDASHADRYPHEFSGGQRQRIGIARALAVEPKFIVCDEPVSALDVSVQAQIVNLLQDLQREHSLAYLFIAHDLAVVEHISRCIMVMYLGKIVECGPTKAVCGTPKHPYTQALISAVPVLDPVVKRSRIVLSGDIPSPINVPSGCPFHPRCPIAEPRCKTEIPALREFSAGHWSACHLVHPGINTLT